jgi:hypothetical protein
MSRLGSARPCCQSGHAPSTRQLLPRPRACRRHRRRRHRRRRRRRRHRRLCRLRRLRCRPRRRQRHQQQAHHCHHGCCPCRRGQLWHRRRRVGWTSPAAPTHCGALPSIGVPSTPAPTVCYTALFFCPFRFVELVAHTRLCVRACVRACGAVCGRCRLLRCACCFRLFRICALVGRDRFRCHQHHPVGPPGWCRTLPA